MKILNHLFKTISFYLLLMFTFILFFKFGLPYTYNISQSSPLNIEEMLFFSWPVEWGMCGLIASTLFLFFSVLCQKKAGWNITRFDCILFMWLVSTLLVFLFHGTHHGGLQPFLLMLSYILYYYSLSFHLKSNKNKKIYCFVVLTCFVFICFYGFYQYFQGLEHTLREAERLNLDALKNPKFLSRLKGKKVFSTFIYSNSMAHYLLIMIPLFLYALVVKRYRKLTVLSMSAGFLIFLFFLFKVQHWNFIVHYLFLFLLFPVDLIYLLSLTKSEGAFISLFLALVLSFNRLNNLKSGEKIKFFSALNSNKKFRNFLILICVLISTVSISFFIVKYQKQMKASVLVRHQYNQASLKMIKDHFLFGVGPGQYGIHYMHYKLREAEEVQLAHNCYLQIFAEYGIFTFVSFMMIFIWSIFILLKKRRGFFVFCLSFSFYGLVIHNMIDFSFFVPALGYLTFFVLYLIHADKEKKVILHLRQSVLTKSLIFLTIIGSLFIFMLLVQISLGISWNDKGSRLLSQKKINPAISCFLNAIAYYPYNSTHYVNCADLYLRMKKFDKASLYYLKALKISQKHAIIWLKYARCLMWDMHFNKHKKHVNDALKAYQNAMKYYPSNDLIRKEFESINWN